MKHGTTRTRIFSYMTRSRFLHVEDSLDIGKIRFFIGEYKRGSGAQATAYHFLDDSDARVIMADLGWGRAVDITDYKGSANGGDGPVSRVLKIKGPKDGKFWVQVDNGPGQVIGAGAVKPAGEPTASISIALPLHDARALALAVIEYVAAWRVTVILRAPAASPALPPPANPRPSADPRLSTPPPARTVDTETGEIAEPAADVKELVGEDSPSAFFGLVNKALAAKILDHPAVRTMTQQPGSWAEKGQELQALMA